MNIICYIFLMTIEIKPTENFVTNSFEKIRDSLLDINC